MTELTPTLLTPTLTQSGLLAVLLQHQRYRVLQLAWGRAHRRRLFAAFGNILISPFRVLTAPRLVNDSAEAFVGTVPRRT